MQILQEHWKLQNKEKKHGKIKNDKYRGKSGNDSNRYLQSVASCGGNCSTGKARTIHFSVLQGLWKNSSKTNQYL